MDGNGRSSVTTRDEAGGRRTDSAVHDSPIRGLCPVARASNEPHERVGACLEPSGRRKAEHDRKRQRESDGPRSLVRPPAKDRLPDERARRGTEEIEEEKREGEDAAAHCQGCERLGPDSANKR